MPLPWNWKFGIHYIYPPFFTQQLGIFSPSPVPPELVLAFLQKVPGRFRLVEIQLNSANPVTAILVNPEEKWKIVYRRNFTLDLSLPYGQISMGYHNRIKKNTLRAENSGLTLVRGIPPEEVVRLFQWKLEGSTPLRPRHYKRFLELASFALTQGTGKTYGVQDPGGKLLSGAFFLFCRAKAHYLIAGNDPQARSSGASQLLLDRFIQEHAGSNLKLDFTGSDIPGIAFFNEGFGGREEHYPFLTRNTLPWPLRLLKKNKIRKG